jgi:hypothetical protein
MAADDMTTRLLLQTLEAFEPIREDVTELRRDIADLRVRHANVSVIDARLKHIGTTIEGLNDKIKVLGQTVDEKHKALDARLDTIEKTHARWLGALGVVAVILGLISGHLVKWLGALMVAP